MRLSKLSLTILKMYFGAQKIYSKRVYIICVYRGRLVHSVLLINANIMQIQTMTNISKNNRPCLLTPAAPLNVQPRLLQNQFVFYLK